MRKKKEVKLNDLLYNVYVSERDVKHKKIITLEEMLKVEFNDKIEDSRFLVRFD